MIIVYTPAGGDAEPERFDTRLRVSETVRAARTVDRPWHDIQGSLNDDAESMRVVAWLVKARSEPGLRYADFDPYADELRSYLDRSEITRWAELIAGIAWLEADATPDTVTAALRVVPSVADDRDHAEALVERLAADRPKDPPSPDRPLTGPGETSSS